MTDVDGLRRAWHRIPLPVRRRVWLIRHGTANVYRRYRTEAAVRMAPRLRRRVPAAPVPAFTLLCIYRERYVEQVVELCRSATAAGGSVRLWSLDGSTHPDLAAHTISSGPGDRPALLNELERSAQTGGAHWLVVTDDDVRLDPGVGELLSMTVNAELDIAQPAHAPASNASFPHTYARPLALARRTEFVEVGPVVVVGPRARPHVFPMDETHLMGLGSELAWMELRSLGIELGIVDCVAVAHLGRIGADYDASLDELRVRIHAAGGPARLRKIHATWYAHRDRPPWSARPTQALR